MKVLDWLCARLSEESTWRGIILIATAAGATLKPEMWQAITSAGLGAVGLINVIRKQSASKAAVATAINAATENIPRAQIVDEKTLLPK